MLKRLYKVGLTARVISSSDDEALNKEDTSKQERINEIDADEDIALVSIHNDELHDEGMEDVGEKEVVEVVTTTKMLVDTIVDATQVATAIGDVSAAKLIVTTAPTITAKSKKTNVEITQAPKRKEVIIQEPKEKTTKIASSQQSHVRDKAIKLQEEIYEQESLVGEKARQEEESNSALIETWEDVQAKVSTKKDKAEIVQESSLKRLGDELYQERSKNQKVEDDKESEELKKCLEIIPDDEDDILIDSTPLSSKSLTIIVYKIYKEGKKNYFQIFRADGWRLDKDIFVKTKLVDGMDSFLLHTLKTMFEHHVKDNV
nr:hypothetical protein [Tanacetum cinerariifolium]